MSGAQDNNLALALAKLGRDGDAATYAGSALAHDPANPIYVDTVAFVQHLAGHEHAAAEAYRARSRPTPPYVSANNLAVLLAQDVHRTDAAAVLADALTVAPTTRSAGTPWASCRRRPRGSCWRRRGRWRPPGPSTATCVAATT